MPIFPILFGVLLVLFLITGLHSLLSGLRARHYQGHTTGVIIEVQHFGSYRKSSRNHNYRPIFRYEVDGVEYKRPFDVTTKNVEQYTVGDTMPLCYDHKDPKHFAPEGDTSMLLSSIPFFLGAAFCAFLLFLCFA